MSQAPKKVGRYEIRRELGRGMMGVVYEARDSMLDRVVALKTIHLAFGVSEADRKNFDERFLTEARSAASLSHPGIVVVHDMGRDPGGTLFMALEYLQGRPLSDLIDADSPLEWRQALRLVADVAQALHHAHAAGVIHRDIKPANIMLLDSGQPKVMDFGLAKLQKSQLSLTSSGQFFGTPLYMSPEQARGEPLDGRSDLFSLGSVAYALLTGRPPFDGESIPQIFLRVASEPPAPPSQLNPALPPGVDALLARAMAKQPEDRYPDGRSMAEDIAEVLADRLPRRPPVTAPPESSSGAVEVGSEGAVETAAARERRPGGARGRGLGAPAWGIGLGVLVAGGLALALAIGRGGSERPAVAAEERPGPTTLTARDTETLASAVAAQLAGDLEGSRELLTELIERDPGAEGAAELLEEVETGLWARDHLPLEFRAEHNHRLGSCRGQLVLDAAGLSYTSRDHGQWAWTFAELQEMRRKSRWEIELATNETEALRLGGAKRYDFKLRSAPLEREEWDRFVRLARGG